MAMAGILGVGTVMIIVLLIILLLLFLLYCLGVPAMKYVAIIYLFCLIIVLAVILTLPYNTDPIPEESNPHFAALCSFGVFIFVGFAVSLVFYIMVVLSYQDVALVLPKF